MKLLSVHWFSAREPHGAHGCTLPRHDSASPTHKKVNVVCIGEAHSMPADVLIFVCAKVERFAAHLNRRFAAFVEAAADPREFDASNGVGIVEVRTHARSDSTAPWFVGGQSQPRAAIWATPAVTATPVLVDESRPDDAVFQLLDALCSDALVLRFVQRLVIVRDAVLTLSELLAAVDGALTKASCRLRIVTPSRSEDAVLAVQLYDRGWTLSPQDPTHLLFAIRAADDKWRMAISVPHVASGVLAQKRDAIDDAVCSASRKIVEALSIRSIDANGLRFLDVGAAPGGWTYEIATRGAATVVAVDAGAMNADVLKLPNVVFLSGLAEKQLARIVELGPFDVLVCDACVIFEFAETLSDVLATLVRDAVRPGGLCIVTLKLPRRSKGSDRQAQRVARIVARLASKFGDAAAASFQVVHLLANTENERTLMMTKPAN
jgi:predicted rRNA methylase YqxC with S4 and FtsJ domains